MSIVRRPNRCFKLISCEIFCREMCLAVARSANRIDVEFLPKGLHDIGAEGMCQRVQQVVDRVASSSYEVVLMGYGLCNNGVQGLRSGPLPLVIPRVHDCIGLFFGSHERYKTYFDAHPDSFYLTTGWLERDELNEELKPLAIGHQMGMDLSWEELVERYGEENARFLYDQLCNTTKNYQRFTFIAMGLAGEEAFEAHGRREAEARGWAFEKVEGRMDMVHRLLSGTWDDREFLVVPPFHQIKASYDDGILRAEPLSEDKSD